MRFRYVKHVILENISMLDTSNIDYSVNSENNKEYYTVLNYKEIMSAVNNIRELGFIEFEIDELSENNNIANTLTQDSKVDMDKKTFASFKKTLDFIYRECAAVRILISDLLPEQSENSVTVGLPDFKEFSDLVEFFKKTSTLFKLLPVEDKEEMEIQNFDSGSMWFELAFSGTTVLMLFGKAIQTTSNLFLKIQHHKIAKQQVNEYIADSELRIQAKKAMTETFIDSLQEDSKKFLAENGIEETPENITNTSTLFTMLGDMMDQGATFESAYNALDCIKEEFPTLDMLKHLPISSIKNIGQQELIEHKDSSDETSEN